MIQYFAYSGDARVFGVFVFVLLLAVFTIGYVVGARIDDVRGKTFDDAFKSTQTAILGLSALILGFTFSLAAQRYDGRRALVSQEANAIGTTYLRADYLPPAPERRFRTLLRNYTAVRIDHYRTFGEQDDDVRSLAATARYQNELWAISATAGRADSSNVQLAQLTQSLNDTIDISAQQETRLGSRIPSSMLGFVVLMVSINALLQGFGFGRSKHLKVGVSLGYLILMSLVVFTIVDLDRPQRGLIKVNLKPLEVQYRSMQ